MLVDLNLWAVLMAALVSLVIGFAWYSQKVFGHIWMKEMHFHQVGKEQRRTELIVGTALVMQIIMAFVLAHFVTYMEASKASEGAETAFWMWLGFALPVLAGKVLWERKSIKLLLIDAAYWWVSFTVAGVILSVWQ